MTSDSILDAILVPRPNGSEALGRVAEFLAERLDALGAEVARQPFQATPHGFELAFSAALLLMLAQLVAIALRRPGAALLLALAAAGLLLAEFEGLHSPVSGLLPALEHNVVGTFAGRPDGPLLVFSAHYDTATHFGDHRAWGRWGFGLGPALGIVLAAAGADWLRRGRGRALPRPLALAAAALGVVPFAAMWWFHAAGPHLREPSPGALDNGGSVAALLRLGERLAQRAPDAPVTVQLVFLAAEEERAFGSRAFARALPRTRPLAVVNLESIGAPGALALVEEDGFALRRFHSPPGLVSFVQETARAQRGAPLPLLGLPPGTLTDGRSFLAEGLPALTLRATEDGAFPAHLHSARDARERLSVDAVEEAVDLLAALVERADALPEALAPPAAAGSPAAP